jgi:nucleotide-binding universal stress UspA family protein
MLDKIEGLVRPVRRKGIPVTVKTSVGKPFIEVIREVIHGRYDLVMIPARRSTNLRRMLFGGTEMHLIRKCPCPVWVIKPKQKVPCTRILAAVGPNLGDDVELELDNAIINLASAVTRLDEGRLHILHAWNLYGESILRGSFGHMKPKEVNKLLRQEFIQHKKNLMELIERHSLNEKNLEVHLLKGTAADIIARVARRKRIDLLVMGTVSRTGIAGVIIGNTAEDILGQVDCSVLAVKPTGFVTPVNI